MSTTDAGARGGEPPGTRLADLVERSATGDETAFAALYTQTVPQAFGLALRVLGDRGRAEDAVRDAYVTIWRTAARYDAQRCGALAWILTAVHRATVEQARATRAADARAERRDAPAAPDPRVALELAYFGGHTYGEVGELLGVSAGTAMSSIRDGLVEVRESGRRPGGPLSTP